MEWSNLVAGILGFLAKAAFDHVRSSMGRNRKARHVATLFEMEIEEIRTAYKELNFSPSEPLGLYPPDITTYSEHGAWRLFELFPGRLAIAVSKFYRSVSEVHKPVMDAQEFVHEYGRKDWKILGAASSSSHRRLKYRFEESKRKLLENADDALSEIRAWRSALPVDVGQHE